MSSPSPSSSSSSLPSAATITFPQFTHLLSLYPSIISKVYAQNPRLKDARKLSQALEDDRWRYEELGGIVEGRRGGQESGKVQDGGEDWGKEREGVGAGAGAWLDKGEVERLVGWKITHGHHRPFLPSLIRQNPAEVIKQTTSSAFFSTLPSPSPTSTPPPFPKAALTTLTKPLKGIGPATATLLLSIYNPDSIPFFSDELYDWLVHQPHEQLDSGARGKAAKLKYDLKEYERLFEAWVEFRESLVLRDSTGKEMGVKAVDVEKVGFVVGNWGMLREEEEKGGVVGLGVGSAEAVEKAGKRAEDGETDARKMPEEGQGDVVEAVGEDGGKAESSLKSVMVEKGGRKKSAGAPLKVRKESKEKRPRVEEDTSARRSKRLRK